MTTQIFSTKRIHIRELEITDANQLFTICGDPVVMKYVGNLLPYSLPQTKQAILKCMKSYGWHGWGGWALCKLENPDELIGYGGFEWVEDRGMPELFYIFHPDCWGKGYASEFATAAIQHAKANYQMTVLGTSFDPANEPSMRVARKAGFTFSHEGIDEFNLPTIYYSLDLTNKKSETRES